MNASSLGGQLNVQATSDASQHNNSGYQGDGRCAAHSCVMRRVTEVNDWIAPVQSETRGSGCHRVTPAQLNCAAAPVRPEVGVSVKSRGTKEPLWGGGGGGGLWQTCRGIGVFKDVHPLGWVRPNSVCANALCYVTAVIPRIVFFFFQAGISLCRQLRRVFMSHANWFCKAPQKKKKKTRRGKSIKAHTTVSLWRLDDDTLLLDILDVLQYTLWLLTPDKSLHCGFSSSFLPEKKTGFEQTIKNEHIAFHWHLTHCVFVPPRIAQ